MKNTYKILFTLFITMLSYMIYGQEINGIITNEQGSGIALVNLQLQDESSGKTISFTQTNQEGKFKISTNGKPFPLKLKAQHYSYEPKEFLLQDNTNVTVVMFSKTNELEEIIIDTKAYDVVKKGDTLKYNLKTLLNGSELKLKDIVKKLPGLAIDSDGKIRYNGAIIDHLLFDGNEFLDNKHQIANDNITAEMIEKIELLTNYKNLSNVKDFETNGKTALNIGIKDNFKNSFKGNLTAESGFKKRYNLHGNVYNFGKKTLFNLVANTNNINYSVLSLKDYMDTRKINGKRIMNEQFSQGNLSISDLDLPSFLFSEDDVKSRKLSNYTLNLSHKFNDKSRIEFISIFNILKQKQASFNLQKFLNNEVNTIERIDEVSGGSKYASNVLKFEQKFKNDTYININTYSLWSNDHQNQFLESNFLSTATKINFRNNIDFTTNKYGINAFYKKKLHKNILLDAIAFYDAGTNQTNKLFNSTETFTWFNSLNNYLFQQTKSKNNDLGLQARTSLKIGNDKLIFRAYTGLSKEHLNNHVDELNLFQLNDTYKKAENIIGLQYQGYIQKPTFNYNLGLQYNYSNYFYSANAQKVVKAVLPNFSISKNISKSLVSYVSYSSQINSFSILNFLTANMIDDYRTYLEKANVKPAQMLTDSYSTGVIYNVPEKNLFSSVSISHSNVRKRLEKTFTNSELFTKQNFQYLDKNKVSSTNISFNKKFRNIPYGFNFNTFGSISDVQTLINNSISENKNYNLSLKLNIQTYFKDSSFNFNTGVEYMYNNIKSRSNIFSDFAKLEKLTPYVTFTGVAVNNKLNWNIDTKYYIYNSSNIQSQNIFNIGFRTQYHFSKNLQLYLNADNILNISDYNTKNNFTGNLNFTQETILHSLSGFVNFGVIFSF